MSLFKSLTVFALFKNTIGFRKVVLSESRVVNRFFQVRSFLTLREKSSNFLGVKRTFCSRSNETICSRSNETIDDYAEDLAGDEEVYEVDYEETNTEKIFQEIADGDPETLKKLKLLEFEVAFLREEESRVPDKMSKQNWIELLQLETMNKRKKYLSFLRLNELKTLSKLEKTKGKREMMLKRKEESGFHYYGLSGHTMFMRVYERKVNKLLINRMWNSKFEILLDCSYQEYMSMLNTKACAKQIFYCLSEARLHRYPCQIKLCNVNKEDALGKTLPNYIPGIYNNHYADVVEESYLDIYPKEKLVYLTPHTKTELHNFNPDDVYIIGAFVDKGTGVKASLAKAKEKNLRTAKLPLDDYLLWKKGTKSLPLNIVMNILLDMAFYDDWNKAFQKVPTRCLTEL